MDHLESQSAPQTSRACDAPALAPAPLRIGPLRLETNLLLAPVSGYTDLAFRLVVRSCGGVGMACTDLLCPEGVVRENFRSMQLAATCAEDWPLCMQLYGADADRLCDAARWAEDHGAAVVDINMGCPVDKITRRDGGSRLLCDPDRTVRMVERIRSVLRRVPLTAKLRLGWDQQHIVAPRLAQRLEEVGVDMITIHGRTTDMRFSGEASLEGIAQVVAAVKSIPVVGNGDVRCPQDAARMIRVTGCRGVMIGRAALSAPWIFRDTWSHLCGRPIPPAPTVEEICQLMRRHFDNLLRFRGEHYAVDHFRKRISWYAKHLHPCAVLRESMRFIRSARDFDRAVARFLLWRNAIAEGAESAPSPPQFSTTMDTLSTVA
jgi:tRNA-dihydrouridine synthase B